MHEDVRAGSAPTYKLRGGRMAGELDARIALVTGAPSGIGRATALRFAREGARVALVGRDAETLASVARDVKDAGGDAVEVRADVTVDGDARRAIEEAVGHFGGLDVLVNAAGILSNGTVENTP